MSNSLTRADADGTLSDLDIDPITAFYARKSRRHESEYPSCDTQIDTCRLYALSQGWENYIIAAAWNQLTEDAKRIVLPTILSRAVLDMSTGEITLGLVDDAAENVGKAAERHTT